MKAKKIGALLLAAVMTFSLAACGGGGKDDSKGDSSSAGSSSDKKRVCFVARASADTFAAWLTTEMKKEANDIFDFAKGILLIDR